MQKIQLYIQGTRMDMFDDESVSITDTIKNVQDISKVFTSFSRSFNLPASKRKQQKYSSTIITLILQVDLMLGFGLVLKYN